jgi:hypothetical protein
VKNIRTAIIIMLVVICGSSTISAVSSMNSMADKVTNYFYNGDGKYTNQSIYSDIKDKAEIAQNLVNLSKNYVNGNDSHIKEITKAVNDISSEKSIKKLYALTTTLDANVLWLLTELGNTALSVTDSEMLVKLQSQYRSETNTINSSNYNTLARQYDDEVSGFPGDIFKLFAHKVEYFE